MVTFTSTIYPIDAKGIVEKWLLQVKLKMVVGKMLSDTKMVMDKMLFDSDNMMMPYTKVAQTKMNSRWKSRWCAH